MVPISGRHCISATNCQDMTVTHQFAALYCPVSRPCNESQQSAYKVLRSLMGSSSDATQFRHATLRRCSVRSRRTIRLEQRRPLLAQASDLGSLRPHLRSQAVDHIRRLCDHGRRHSVLAVDVAGEDSQGWYQLAIHAAPRSRTPVPPRRRSPQTAARRLPTACRPVWRRRPERPASAPVRVPA